MGIIRHGGRGGGGCPPFDRFGVGTTYPFPLQALCAVRVCLLWYVCGLFIGIKVNDSGVLGAIVCSIVCSVRGNR